MISRIFVFPKGADPRGKFCVKSWKNSGLSRKIRDAFVLDSYLLRHEFSPSELKRAAKLLVNPILEDFSIDELPAKKFDSGIAISYLPGVTDNVAHTVAETISDSLGSVAAFTSKIFLIRGGNAGDMKKIAGSLYN